MCFPPDSQLTWEFNRLESPTCGNHSRAQILQSYINLMRRQDFFFQCYFLCYLLQQALANNIYIYIYTTYIDIYMYVSIYVCVCVVIVSRWPLVPSGHNSCVQRQQQGCRFNLWLTQTGNNLHSPQKHGAHCARRWCQGFFEGFGEGGLPSLWEMSTAKKQDI